MIVDEAGKNLSSPPEEATEAEPTAIGEPSKCRRGLCKNMHRMLSLVPRSRQRSSGEEAAGNDTGRHCLHTLKDVSNQWLPRDGRNR